MSNRDGANSGDYGSDSGDDCDNMCCFRAYLWCFSDRGSGTGKTTTGQAQHCAMEELATSHHESSVATPPPLQDDVVSAAAAVSEEDSLPTEDQDHVEMITRDGTQDSGEVEHGVTITTPEDEGMRPRTDEVPSTTMEVLRPQDEDPSTNIALTPQETCTYLGLSQRGSLTAEAGGVGPEDEESSTNMEIQALRPQDKDPSTDTEHQGTRNQGGATVEAGGVETQDDGSMEPQGEALSATLEHQGPRHRCGAMVEAGGVGPQDEASTILVAGGAEPTRPNEDSSVGAKDEISPITILFLIIATVILILLMTLQR